jgi:hypothetical protein
MEYLDELRERGVYRDEHGPYRPCDEPGPYGARCTLYPTHDWSHYDGPMDVSWQDRWRNDAPDPDD